MEGGGGVGWGGDGGGGEGPPGEGGGGREEGEEGGWRVSLPQSKYTELDENQT